jgi:hypothetical protein
MEMIWIVIVLGICIYILTPVAWATQTDPGSVDQAVADANEKTGAIFPKLIEEAAKDAALNPIFKTIDDLPRK